MTSRVRRAHQPREVPNDAGRSWRADEVAAAARGFADAVARIEAGELAFPLPGSGRTAERFAALRTVAEAGLSTARLVEGHVDATAILAELGAPPPGPGERWGVWAAEPRARGSPPSGRGRAGC